MNGIGIKRGQSFRLSPLFCKRGFSADIKTFRRFEMDGTYPDAQLLKTKTI